MNEYQAIYTLFYSLFSAMAISITGKTHPFDTPSMLKGYPKSWLRFCYSAFILNFLPLVSFVWIYNELSKLEDNYQLTIPLALFLFLPSLVALGFYRIHYGSMLIKGRSGKHLFYDQDLYNKTGKGKNKGKNGLPYTLSNDLDSRPEFHTEPLTHIIPGIFWVMISVTPTLFFLNCYT